MPPYPLQPPHSALTRPLPPPPCYLGLQAADLSAHELGDLLSEIRQADLKLQEMRLAQRAACREGTTLALTERYRPLVPPLSTAL